LFSNLAEHKLYHLDFVREGKLFRFQNGQRRQERNYRGQSLARGHSEGGTYLAHSFGPKRHEVLAMDQVALREFAYEFPREVE